MAFKTDSSFLRFLTMGAVGVRSAAQTLREAGFEPIELERYCASNKIWMTKVKRLRLPDLLCVRTGVRIEVRAKSDLKVRMSDAPDNPDRRWDVGLRDDDLVAFVTCDGGPGAVRVVGPPSFLTVGDMRASVGATRLGPPKSASEGAERDREWPTWVPGASGRVATVDAQRIRVEWDQGGGYTYALRGKTAYLRPGDAFPGRCALVAGVLPRLASLDQARARRWDPISALGKSDPVDRYAAAKAVPHLPGAQRHAATLAGRIAGEPDDRVALELAASATRLGSAQGLAHLATTVANHARGDLRMEAVLILTELGSAEAAEVLSQIAANPALQGEELRQAATWGLGKAGCHTYGRLLPLLRDADDAVVLHAIVAFGEDTPAAVVDELMELLTDGSPRMRSAVSEALRVIGGDVVLQRLVGAAREQTRPSPWVLATLGRLPSGRVRGVLAGAADLAERMEPLQLLSEDENWLRSADAMADLRFLEQQDR